MTCRIRTLVPSRSERANPASFGVSCSSRLAFQPPCLITARRLSPRDRRYLACGKQENHVLRITRIDVPQLPRPAYEVQAWLDGPELVVFVMAGRGWRCEGEQFAWRSSHRPAAVTRWLEARPLSEASSLWRPLVPLIVGRVEAWVAGGGRRAPLAPAVRVWWPFRGSVERWPSLNRIMLDVITQNVIPFSCGPERLPTCDGKCRQVRRPTRPERAITFDRFVGPAPAQADPGRPTNHKPTQLQDYQLCTR